MISSYSSSDLLRISIFTGILLLLLSFSQRFVRRRQSTGTQLLGPPSPSFLFGHLRLLIKAPNGRGEIYEQWAKTYGPAYRVAGPLGSTRVVICDPRALAHYYSKETFTYVQSKFTKVLMANIVRILVENFGKEFAEYVLRSLDAVCCMLREKAIVGW